jgi:2-polyprenyl-6-hydroxyphenyl methylase/3-demethylubiquinone-9 3-methyltransferase
LDVVVDFYLNQCARLGANVTGIDASDKNIKIAKLHAKKNKLNIKLFCSSPEKLKN